jgi:hypothetical protein
MGAFLGRRLDKLDLIALFVDALEIARHAVVVALGVTTDGTRFRSVSGSARPRTPSSAPRSCRACSIAASRSTIWRGLPQSRYRMPRFGMRAIKAFKRAKPEICRVL